MRTSVFDGVNVRIFEPESPSKKPRPALIYIHGGWFAIGSSGILLQHQVSYFFGRRNMYKHHSLTVENKSDFMQLIFSGILPYNRTFGLLP